MTRCPEHPFVIPAHAGIQCLRPVTTLGPRLRGGDARRTQRGVTLLELLVVLALLALLATVTLPLLGSGVSTTAMKGAARELAAALRQARSDAMATRTETLVTIDLEGRRFVVGGDPKPRSLPRELEIKLFTAQMDIVDDRVGGIRFYPDGGSNGGRVTLAAGERKFEVDVDWLTGRVAILE
jgi:general secretion pathway protein H